MVGVVVKAAAQILRCLTGKDGGRRVNIDRRQFGRSGLDPDLAKRNP